MVSRLQRGPFSFFPSFPRPPAARFRFFGESGATPLRLAQRGQGFIHLTLFFFFPRFSSKTIATKRFRELFLPASSARDTTVGGRFLSTRGDAQTAPPAKIEAFHFLFLLRRAII
jgi:hypothetical protein